MRFNALEGSSQVVIRNPIRGFDAEITKLTDMRQLYPNQNKCEIEEHQKDFFLIYLNPKFLAGPLD